MLLVLMVVLTGVEKKKSVVLVLIGAVVKTRK